MRAEICPTCEGWCCRDGSEMHSPHRVMVYHKHVCPDCRTGMVWTERTKSASKSMWTAEQERAAVVAWLRKWGGDCDDAAETIERGEHRKEEE
jgi:hypothetical protein